LFAVNELTRDQQQQMNRIGQPQTACPPTTSHMDTMDGGANALPTSLGQSTELIRAEARRRFEQFQQLSTSSTGELLFSRSSRALLHRHVLQVTPSCRAKLGR
jgi:hypothetical protein